MSSDVKQKAENVGSPVVVSSVAVSAPRQTMIETAMKFLQNPQVRQSPVATRKAFLIKKGLTEEEIDMALERSGPNIYDKNTPVTAMVSAPLPVHQQTVPYQAHGWRGYTTLAVLIGGIIFCIYKFYKNVIAPMFRRRQEEAEALKAVENAVTELKSSITGTVTEVHKIVGSMQTTLHQQEQKLDQLSLELTRSRSMVASVKNSDSSEIKNEIASLKGLLLSRHQFPQTPTPSPIPAWQMAPSKSSGEDNSAKDAIVTEPAGGDASTTVAINKPVSETHLLAKPEQVTVVAASTSNEEPQHNTVPQSDLPTQPRSVVRSLSGSFVQKTTPSKLLQGTARQVHNGNKNNGQMNDRGQVVNDRGQVINGKYQQTNDKGQVVNNNGQQINDKGQVINGKVVNAKGQQINDKGSKGQQINGKGDGHIYDDIALSNQSDDSVD